MSRFNLASFIKSFPAKAVIPYRFHVIAANWTSSTPKQSRPGRGHSCIITREGKVLAMSEKVSGNAIVISDLAINAPIASRCLKKSK